MSCVCILTPMVVAAWPAFSSAVAAAAVSLGYTVVDQAASAVDGRRRVSEAKKPSVQIEIDQSEIVTDSLSRGQTIAVTRNGVVVSFARDPRGKASLCVDGAGFSDSALRAIGEELSARVVHQYVYQRLLDEMHKREFTVVDEQTLQDGAVRLKVRRWDN